MLCFEQKNAFSNEENHHRVIAYSKEFKAPFVIVTLKQIYYLIY